MHKKFLVVSVVIVLLFAGIAQGYVYQAPVKSSKLPRSLPELEGVNSKYIYDLLDAFEFNNIEIHSFLIATNGKEIFSGYWAPYNEDTPHIIHSLTKLFTNAAAGVAVTEGKLSLDTKLIDLYPAPENAPENLKDVTLRYLITMTGGYDRMISGSEWRPLKTSWMEAFLKEPIPHKPGTHYQYSSGNAYAVSAMVQAATGKTCLDLLLESGFNKLGMANFTWDLSPEGICSGGNGVTCTTEDMLKVGLLFLNMGKWNGEQILSEEWCKKAIGLDKVIDNQGPYAFHWTDQLDGNYTAGGAYGQYVILAPKLNIVIAMTAGTSETNKEYELVYQYLLKPTEDDGNNRKYNDTMTEVLKNKARVLNLLQNPIATASPVGALIDGKEFKASSNEDKITSAKLDVTNDYIDFTMTDDRGTHKIRNGIGQWLRGETTMTGNYLHHQYQNEIEPYTAYAKWKDNTTLELTWRYPEMAFVDTVILKFLEDGSAMSMIRSVNVNSSALVRPEVKFEAQ